MKAKDNNNKRHILFDGMLHIEMQKNENHTSNRIDIFKWNIFMCMLFMHYGAYWVCSKKNFFLLFFLSSRLFLLLFLFFYRIVFIFPSIRLPFFSLLFVLISNFVLNFSVNCAPNIYFSVYWKQNSLKQYSLKFKKESLSYYKKTKCGLVESIR